MMEESVKFGVIAATKNPQINYEKVNYSKAPWTNSPSQCINYSSCHDNHTLWDRLLNSNANDDEATRLRMYRLAESIVLTSQGIPFLHAGTEICRSKKNVENSFNSGDDINAIDWSNKIKYKTTFDYFCKMIALRKAHPAFRMATTAQIVDNLKFMDAASGTIAYTLNGEKVGDTWKKIFILYNSNRTATKITLPEGKWKCALDGDTFYEKGKKVKGKTLEVKGISTVILWE
jgi:pullulanase